MRLAQVLLVGLFVVAVPGVAVAADVKEPYGSSVARARRSGETAVLTNGTGDGTVTVTVDGFGAFGSSAGTGDAYYDPVGSTERSGTVFESAVYFGPVAGFLATGDIGGSGLMAAPTITQPSNLVARSSFTVGAFSIKLTQRLRAPTSRGSTLSQTYVIKNNSTQTQTVTLARHVDGDLYFVGGYSNDFGGVSADGKTLYEFDSGDDPSSPVTFVGITSTGGQSGGFTIQPYRFTDDIIDAGGIPTDLNGAVYDDDNGDGVTDDSYDITLTQQNTLTIPPGQSRTYTTSTIFGEGSINDATAAVSGCIKLNNEPLVNRNVLAKQTGEPNQTTKTDSVGCYTFDSLRSGKTFSITIAGPRLP